MIPLRLRLKNFMSYAELDLDLRGVHTAVLTGANGAGKSSLLDAITYAIWDKARSTGDQLIRLGQAEMWVELVFRVDDRVYRVWRRRVTKKNTPMQVELHQALDSSRALADDAGVGPDADPGAYVALTGTSVRETQARLLQTVRMDYETFTNSAFILQGKADQFTTKTPRERKALLAEILGLTHYDALAQAAREKQRTAQQRMGDLEAEQGELRARVAGRPEVESRLAAARDGAASVALMLGLATGRQARLQAEEAQLLAADGERQAAIATQAQAAASVQAAEAALREREAAIAAAETRVAARGAIEADYAAWQQAQADEAAARGRADAWQAAERAIAEATAARQAALHALDLALAGKRQALEAQAAEAAGLDAAVRDRARTEAASDALEAARAAERAALAVAEQAEALAARERACEAELTAWRARADASRQEAARRLAGLRREAAALPAVTKELAEVAGGLAELDRAAEAREKVQEEGQAHRSAFDQLQARRTHAEEAVIALDAKLAQLEVTLEMHGAPSGAGRPNERAAHRSSACPLCETPLAAEELGKIRREYARERAEQAQAAQDLAAQVTTLDEALRRTRETYKTLGAKLKGREALSRREGELVAKQAMATAAAKDAEALEVELALAPEPPAELVAALTAAQAERAALAADPAALAAARQAIAEHGWAEAARWKLGEADMRLAAIAAERPALDRAVAALAAERADVVTGFEATLGALAAERDATGHDPSAHAALRERLAGLADAPDRWGRLQQDLLGLAGAKAEAAGLDADRARYALALATAGGAIADADRRLARRDDWAREAAATEAELKRLREEEHGRHAEIGRLESELSRLDEDAAKLASREAEWNAAVEDVQAYKELVMAFGKDGIQALIIENTLPELEEEANRLLSRISDNRMHVRLATQREKKTGGVAETLEIHISDEVGTRAYELYSGGEAFRVNFALRLALSRLLARRAGARLATLVIDEGFGTQDDKGRERLVEAINAVSGEFERILVITHIRELKDAFNTQIEVSKRGGVSEVKLTA